MGIVNAWDDEAFAAAVRATGKRNIVMAGATTDVCLVPPATSAVLEGFNVQASFVCERFLNLQSWKADIVGSNNVLFEYDKNAGRAMTFRKMSLRHKV